MRYRLYTDPVCCPHITSSSAIWLPEPEMERALNPPGDPPALRVDAKGPTDRPAQSLGVWDGCSRSLTLGTRSDVRCAAAERECASDGRHLVTRPRLAPPPTEPATYRRNTLSLGAMPEATTRSTGHTLQPESRRPSHPHRPSIAEPHVLPLASCLGGSPR